MFPQRVTVTFTFTESNQLAGTTQDVSSSKASAPACTSGTLEKISGATAPVGRTAFAMFSYTACSAIDTEQPEVIAEKMVIA